MFAGRVGPLGRFTPLGGGLRKPPADEGGASFDTVTDSFDRADNASSLGDADTGETWTALSGVWGIASNLALTSDAAAPIFATIDVGAPDIDMEADLSYPEEAIIVVGLGFRMQDATNGLVAYVRPNLTSVVLARVVGGVTTTITSDTIPSVAGSATLRVTAVGDDITVYIDGVSVLASTVSDFNTETQHGLYKGLGTTARWNDFSLAMPA